MKTLVKTPVKTSRLLFLVLVAIATLGIVLVSLDLGLISVLATVSLSASLVALFLWGIWKLYNAFLWKVGRRLAFSYFLIGVLPIPLVMMVLAAVAYIQSGFILGHLHQDAVEQVQSEMDTATRLALERAEALPPQVAAARFAEDPAAVIATGGNSATETGAATGLPVGGVAYALYRDGERTAGDPRLPETWPGWFAEPEPESAAEGATDSTSEPADTPQALQLGGFQRSSTAFYADDEGRPTLASAAGDGSLGVAAVYVGDLAQELTERCDVWVRLYGPDSGEAAEGRVDVEVMGRDMALKTDPRRSPEAAKAYFAARGAGVSHFEATNPEANRPEASENATTDPAAADTETTEAPTPEAGWLDQWWDSPFLWWGEMRGPLYSLADGETVVERFGIGLNAPPRTLNRHLFSTSAELDVSVWTALFVFAFLLFDVYLVAALMAGIMIYALSRAVNRLSQATDAVRSGDFSVRIPVRRRDQVGELQRSFNTMAENLEELVATATQKELLEKELSIARDLQLSLVPRDLPHGEGIEFASLFEPSAAIGGDYFDVLRLGEDRLAVIVADVSGHGLPTGLRMAMLKSALTILVAEERPVEEILAKLDAVVRLEGEERFFVTATIALLDFRDGCLEITNAGHPPTYLLRRGTVREILLPGQPLGGISHTWGKETVDLEDGDVLVWLSDGLIEAGDEQDEAFGYDGVENALRQISKEGEAALESGLRPAGLTAAEVRDGLVAAVNDHTGGLSAQDDRTLVVLRYSPQTRSPPESVPTPASPE